MSSIKQLEKLIKPYWIGAGASSDFYDYDEYRNNGVTSRLDEQDWGWRGIHNRSIKKHLKKL